MSKEEGQKGTKTTRITIDLSHIPEDQFAPDQPLRIAAIRDDEIIDEQVLTPAEQARARSFEVQLNLGPDVDGVAGANIVAAPADDRRNLFSVLTARKFVAGVETTVDGGNLLVNPNIYRWWRFCWFPRTYRITGRVVHNTPDCPQPNPVPAATVEAYDVDFCWWWFDQDLLATGDTDADGFFEIEFTWCVPLWCFLRPVLPPLYVDPDLRERLWEAIRERIPFPEPVPPGDPWRFEKVLREAGVQLPNLPRRFAPRESSPRLADANRLEHLARTITEADYERLTLEQPGTRFAKQTASPRMFRREVEPRVAPDWRDLFGHIIDWPICDDPCDWLPDIRLRVTQDQPDAGTVEVYNDSFFDIRWNLDHDLDNVTLEANEDALYIDACQPDPLLGNCMIFERVGHFNVSEIYQPNLDIPTVAVSYGTTPDRRQRLGRTVNMDRAWCLSPGVHGDFGIAANVDYYRVEIAKWTDADLIAWETDPAHIPPESAFSPVTPSILGGFNRKYLELQTGGFFHYYKWRNETFAPQTVAGIHGLYKSRQRFEDEYLSDHGGIAPAPDFGGWYWDTSTMTRLFNIDTTKLDDGVYTFRLIGYTQTGVDGDGNPLLELVDMGLPNGVCKRCGGADAPDIPALLTLLTANTLRRPTCEIVSMKKNGTQTIDECEILVLDDTDFVSIEFEASNESADPGVEDGNLERYGLWLERGTGPEANLLGIAPPDVVITPGSPGIQDGPTYPLALIQGATAPYWHGGTWTVDVQASVFNALGGSCAFNLTLRAWNRQTNGWSAGHGWGQVRCGMDRAFTAILAADRAIYCAQLGCEEEMP